jgi:flagellar protein FlbT
MNKPIRISLRAGERIFVNGAVLRVDRKTSIEFLNNVVFLLEQHVMQEEEATTPLRRLYFTVQKLLIEPANGFNIRQEYYRRHLELLDLYEGTEIVDRLGEIRALINTGRNFEALKRIRALFALEDALRGPERADGASREEGDPARAESAGNDSAPASAGARKVGTSAAE